MKVLLFCCILACLLFVAWTADEHVAVSGINDKEELKKALRLLTYLELEWQVRLPLISQVLKDYQVITVRDVVSLLIEMEGLGSNAKGMILSAISNR